MPKDVSKAVLTPDRILLRLNKLLASPGGLSSFLSTLNYTLYFLTHIETKASPLKTRLALLLGGDVATPKAGTVVPTAPSHIAALSGLLSQTRTTLRLFGLLPIYAWARQLAQGPKPGQDQVLYATSVTQCALYVVFQLAENLAVLNDSGALPPRLLSRWTEKTGGKATSIALLSYRAWFFGFCCDFVRLAREAQLEHQRRSKRNAAETKDIDNWHADKRFDAKWWEELVVPIGWFPVGYHFAALNEGGFPGFNMGLMGFAGALAGWSRFKSLWDATADI